MSEPKVWTWYELREYLHEETSLNSGQCHQVADALMGLCVESYTWGAKDSREAPKVLRQLYPVADCEGDEETNYLALIIAPDAEPERDAPSDEYRRDAEACAEAVLSIRFDAATTVNARRILGKAKGE